MKTLLTIIGVTLSSCLFAQPSIEWAISAGGISTDSPNSTTTDVSNNVYTTGAFQWTVDFDPGPGTSNLNTTSTSDIFVQKLDSNGDFVWALSFGASGEDEGFSIETDATGNIYVTGHFQNTVDFDPGPGTLELTSNGGYDIFVLKLDPSGAILWAKNMGSTGSDRGLGISIDQLGNVYTIGEFRETVDFDPGFPSVGFASNGSSDVFIQKLDPSGNYLWAVALGDNSTDYVYSLDHDASNNLYVSGRFSGTVDFDPGTGTTNLASINGSMFILKLDELANLEWIQQYGPSGSYSRGVSLVVDDFNNILITGDFFGTVDFDPGAGVENLVATTTSGRDLFILKLDPSGSYDWAHGFGNFTGDNNVPGGINTDIIGDVYVTGTFSGTIDFNPGLSISNYTAQGFRDAFILKLSSSGNFEWLAQMGGVNDTYGKSIVVDGSNSIITCGYFQGTGDFNPFSGTLNLTSNGANDIFIQKLSQCIPSAPVPNLSSLTNLTNQCSVSAPTAPTATSCSGTFSGIPDVTFPITSQGTTTVTWTYEDGNGNTSTQTQEVIIDDVTAPAADAASLTNLTNECEVTTLTAPTATDNCVGAVTGTHSVSLPITSTTTITWTYDDGNGNTSTQTQEVIIDDVTAPVADIASLSDVTAQCEVTSLIAPTATDNCVGTIAGTHNATLPITATTTITWTYDDGNGNTSTQTQEVIIDDVTAPVADVASLSDVTAQCEVTSLIAPTATDNCVGSVSGTHSATLPITSTTTITWTYDDGNGNTSTQTQEVIIDDVTAPMADVASLSDVTADCEVTSLTAPTATDNCAGSITGTHNASLPITAQGTTTVTWTYDDGNGNTSTQTQDVVITDGTAPAADVANLSDINSECEVTPTAPTATDNCEGAVTGTPDVSFPITATGTTTVTWTYDDGNGNTSTQTQDVIITPIDNSVSVVDDLTLSADASGYTYQWVDCNDNNEPIAGETAQTIEAIANGSYAVIIDNGDCSVTSSCFDITAVGLDNNELIEINVYPNPTSGIVNIESSIEIESIELVNALGQHIAVYSGDQKTIQITTAPGVYFLKIITQGQEKIVRLIKQ